MTITIHRAARTALDPALIARWAAVPVTITADLHAGRTLVDPVIRPLRRLSPGPRLVGRAVTARCAPPDFGAVLHAVARAGRGEVVVIDARGDRDTAVIGELLSGAARRNGVAGVLCDGAVRDVGALALWEDFPVFTRWITARGPDSKSGGSVDAAVCVGGVTVAPGDLLVGDDDGVVVLSPAEAVASIDAAEAKVRAECDWETRLQAGDSPLDVFDVPPGVFAGDAGAGGA